MRYSKAQSHGLPLRGSVDDSLETSFQVPAEIASYTTSKQQLTVDFTRSCTKLGQYLVGEGGDDVDLL